MATLHNILVPLAIAASAVGAAWTQPEKQPAATGAPAKETPQPAKISRDDTAAEKLGWRLAVQAWTFRDRTAFEAIDATARLQVKYIEFYPGQKLSPAGEEKVGPEMSAEAMEALKTKLAEAGVRAMNFGVVNFKKDKEEARKTFKWAKDLGIETITCEPEPDAWEIVEECCYEFSMNAACHDHPKPSRYWDPQTVVKAIQQRGQRCGACADTGHWKRSGLVPVECLHKLRGRIICLHFKDIKDGVDQPWGTGDCDAKGMLEELHAQAFRGVIAIEYETGKGPELEANAAKCVESFDKMAREILAENER